MRSMDIVPSDKTKPNARKRKSAPPPVCVEKPVVWPYLVGFLLFLLGGSMSIFTLLSQPQVSAAPPVLVTVGSTSPSVAFEYGPQPRLSEPTFYKKMFDTFVENRQSFIEADLSTMKIRYYSGGTSTFEAPILAKGKEGSWWETPSGLYEIQTKEPNHLSSFGGVYQPWSMVFQGNFFIHGWPYYPDGRPVATSFSGGCIRLGDEDAKKLFELTSQGTPVLVHESADRKDAFIYETPLPEVDAKAFLIADIESGTILAEHQADEELPIASITKLMTALVAAEYINLDKEITITEGMPASTSVPRLEAGMKMTAYSLLFPLLLESSNEAAKALGSFLGSGFFVERMNQKAASLGMEHTRFADTSGAHAGNTSTAKDMLRFIDYIYHNRSFVLNISAGKPINGAYNSYDWGVLSNFNETPGIEGLVGGKVGKTTAAAETAALVYRMNINGAERTLLFVVLGTPDRFNAVRALHSYVEDQYGSHKIEER